MDALSIDTAWLQHYVGYGRFRYDVESTGVWWLTLAARNRDFTQIRHRLAAGANTTQPNFSGTTPLQYACDILTPEMMYYVTCVYPEIVRVLTTTLGRKPVQMEIYGVATNKRARKFRFHVKKRVDETVDKFMNAVRNGDVKTVQSMVEHDEIGVNAVDKSTGETALLASLVARHTQVAAYLLREGAYTYGVSCMNGERLTALIASVRTGDVDLAREVAVHTCMSLAQSYGLVEAVKLGSIEMIETLSGLGITFDLWALHGIPSFMQSIMYTAGASSEGDEELWVLLCAACWLRDKHLFNYLLRTRDKVLIRDFHVNDVAVLLVFAVYQEETALVLELLQSGAPINLTVGSGINSLVAAVSINSTRMLHLLLERGGDVNRVYHNAMMEWAFVTSLLAAAVHANAMDCVRILLPLETRPEAREKALQEAVRRGHVKMVELLLGQDIVPSPEFPALPSLHGVSSRGGFDPHAMVPQGLPGR